jgi:hypothetical protein
MEPTDRRGEMQQTPERRMRPQMKQLVREASRALATLDSERLEELALSCQALNRDASMAKSAEQSGRVRDAQEAKQDMMVLERVLEATRANIDVMRRLGQIRDGKPEYGPRNCGVWSLTETDRGDH